MKNNIEDNLSEILEDMVLSEKNISFTGYHGSQKDDDLEYKQYYDVHRNIWTTREKAIEGYILDKISPIIIKLTK